MARPDDLLFLEPVIHNNIWGGRKLKSEWGYDIPDGPVGEAWVIGAHPHGDCRVAAGPYAGWTLSRVWAEAHDQVFAGVAGDRFPLLVKIIDAEQDLSIQVHPDDAYAAEHEHGSLGKCECWYVLDAAPGATIIVGQHAPDRTHFEAAVKAGAWDTLLNEIPIAAGDFFQIEPGCVHAIKGGTTILETQQSSDITYRVYDYDRPQADGTLRPLHLAQSLDVINFDAQPPQSGTITAQVTDGITKLVSCPRYEVCRVVISGDKNLHLTDSFMCVSVIEGSGQVEGVPVAKGTNFVVAAGVGELAMGGNFTAICSYLPEVPVGEV